MHMLSNFDGRIVVIGSGGGGGGGGGGEVHCKDDMCKKARN
jgi:hypothetical protein